MNSELKHEMGKDYDIVKLIINDRYERCRLVLDKQLDVSDNIKEEVNMLHYALELVCKGLNDEYIEIEDS